MSRDASEVQTSLQDVLQKLEIPQDFGNYEDVKEADAIVRLELWRQQALLHLSNLRDLVKQRVKFEREELAHLVFITSAFQGEQSFISDEAKNLASDILEPFRDTDASLLEQVLRENVKPIFQANPHPSLNINTGRKLPVALGGPLAQQDYYEGQVWKSHPGLPNTISWCVRHIKTEAFEKLWHLVIPPVMTLLDDYEVRYKIRGVHIVSELLHGVPSELLKRTGVGDLLYTSLRSCLNYLHNPDTPPLLRASIPAVVSLVTVTTAPGSSQRFEKLCPILGDSIIGGVWLYGSRDVDSIEATLEVLPQLLDALGVASTRFLKGLIPQFVHPLTSDGESMPPIKFQLKSLHALGTVIANCAPRMHRWKGTVIDGVGRRWVSLVESGVDDADTRELEAALKDIARRLASAVPSIRTEEFQSLIQTDSNMFRPLFDDTERYPTPENFSE